MVSNPFQCLTLSLLILPPLILTTYFFASFPNPPEALPVYASLASLSASSRARAIYPETFYEGGAYVRFPYGRVSVVRDFGTPLNDTRSKVRYWLLGPEDGKKVLYLRRLILVSC